MIKALNSVFHSVASVATCGTEPGFLSIGTEKPGERAIFPAGYNGHGVGVLDGLDGRDGSNPHSA